MNKASEDLVHEHEAVLFALKILERMVTQLQAGVKVGLEDLSELLNFFKLFTDTCHHGKEEKFYFPALEKAGIAKKNGPIDVMLAEHEQGREYLKGMLNNLDRTKIAGQEFIEPAIRYLTLLRTHINKENQVLFPLGDMKLSPARQEDILNEFARFEDEVIGKGKHEELHKLLKKLHNTYNPL
jgi:hemerythrin-like domain-containing protein